MCFQSNVNKSKTTRIALFLLRFSANSKEKIMTLIIVYIRSSVPMKKAVVEIAVLYKFNVLFCFPLRKIIMQRWDHPDHRGHRDLLGPLGHLAETAYEARLDLRARKETLDHKAPEDHQELDPRVRWAL